MRLPNKNISKFTNCLSKTASLNFELTISSLIILICETESSSYSVTNSNCTNIKSRRRVCLRLGSSREPLCTLELEAWKGNISAACLYSYGAFVFLGRQSNRQFSWQNHFGRGLSANNCLLIFFSHVLVDILDWTSR